jgi:hypothetical protein
MDFVKSFTSEENQQQGQNQNQQGQQEHRSNQQGGGGFLGGLSDKLNSTAGGGKESEKNEDMLDKGCISAVHSYSLVDNYSGIDFVQEKFLGQGPQDNESAVEQAKDEQISDFIRGKYKDTTGDEIPIKDKETRFG